MVSRFCRVWATVRSTRVRPSAAVSSVDRLGHLALDLARGADRAVHDLQALPGRVLAAVRHLAGNLARLIRRAAALLGGALVASLPVSKACSAPGLAACAMSVFPLG